MSSWLRSLLRRGWLAQPSRAARCGARRCAGCRLLTSLTPSTAAAAAPASSSGAGFVVSPGRVRRCRYSAPCARTPASRLSTTSGPA
eukprot:CAMPEP_0113699726 /NCGR_PEP_ID=MMETSP0038_2-20120614/23510_1 /TAXON_ID=2898 /ORGANISM="Cryptomonas paramecium" /LENGTH=86 /DNA_ID=CAMNT_0000623201 /DNA_START=164 /DNA_END=420 /DNA_ORIENTATION=+ /assembly_acc=CAM_ASM_000170